MTMWFFFSVFKCPNAANYDAIDVKYADREWNRLGLHFLFLFCFHCTRRCFAGARSRNHGNRANE